jgi:outer membrane protein assembly factor BamB
MGPDMLRPIFSARVIQICLAGAMTLHAAAAAAYSWDRPHGSSTNAGFFDAATIPANTPLKVIQNIGTFAPNASPVIGPDGTVYVGNEQGKLMAFHADGTPWWSRDIPGQSISASPLLGADGSIYVVGIKPFTDHRFNPPEHRFDAMLHKFTVGGGWIRQTPFPEKYGAAGTSDIAPAAPNMWKSGNAEVIMVPVIYDLPLHGGWETHLLAFSTDAQILADATVGDSVPTVTGGSGLPDWAVYSCLIPPFLHCIGLVNSGFQSKPGAPTEPVHDPVLRPVPTAAVYTYPGGGTPHVLVADGFHNLVDYTFGGMNFNEIFRIDDGNDDGAVWATPTVTYDGHTIFTSKDGIRFAGPNMNTVPTVKGTYTITAPTILRDGRIVVMATDGSITVLNGEQVVTRIPIEFSVASAAASHTHFFVSTWHHFITFDATTLQEVGRFDWPDGGLSSPAIGPQGNVYVIASNQLYVFPGPGQAAVATTGTVGNPALPVTQSPVQPVATQPAQPAEPAQPSQASRKAYKPPLTASGNRLFACQDPGGDDCGKGDAKDIAKAFCQKQGFTAAADLDLDTRKGKAETLDGQFCARNKCRVFSKIVCAN